MNEEELDNETAFDPEELNRELKERSNSSEESAEVYEKIRKTSKLPPERGLTTMDI